MLATKYARKGPAVFILTSDSTLAHLSHAPHCIGLDPSATTGCVACVIRSSSLGPLRLSSRVGTPPAPTRAPRAVSVSISQEFEFFGAING